MNTHSTFGLTPHTTYTRRALVVRLAALDLDGIPHGLIGALPDAVGDESAIVYGIATLGEIQAAEAALGQTLDKCQDEGTWVECHIGNFLSGDLGNYTRLVAVKPMPVYDTFRSRELPSYYHLGGTSYRDQLAAAVNAQRKATDELEARRQAAMQLRQKWSPSDAKHKGDYGFLPKFAQALLRNHSRAWLALPAPPASAEQITTEPPTTFLGRLRTVTGMA